MQHTGRRAREREMHAAEFGCIASADRVSLSILPPRCFLSLRVCCSPLPSPLCSVLRPPLSSARRVLERSMRAHPAHVLASAVLALHPARCITLRRCDRHPHRPLCAGPWTCVSRTASDTGGSRFREPQEAEEGRDGSDVAAR